MIPQGVQVFVALDPVDLRCSFDRLSGIAKEQIGYEARSGALFVFYGRRRDALKVLFFDGGGMCIFYKRLDRCSRPHRSGRIGRDPRRRGRAVVSRFRVSRPCLAWCSFRA
jgi:transposase